MKSTTFEVHTPDANLSPVYAGVQQHFSAGNNHFEHRPLSPEGTYQDVINSENINVLLESRQPELDLDRALSNSPNILSLTNNSNSAGLGSSDLSTSSNTDPILGAASQSFTGQGFGSAKSFGTSTQAKDSNGTLGTAIDAGRLTKKMTKTGRIGQQYNYGRDKHDYWKFTVTGDSLVSISLTGLTGNAGLALYNQSGQLISWSNKGGKSSESVTRWLGQGSYHALAYSYSGQGASYKLNLSQGKTLSSYLLDSSVRSATSKSLQDGLIDRDEVMSILRSAKDLTVSSTEVKELRNIINSSEMQIEDHARVLGRKVVSKNRANSESGIKNLTAGSSAYHMEKLVGKWFLGTDRPDAISKDGKTTYSYSKVNKPLFKDGVSYKDISQGDLGDCYFLAGLGAAALHNPSAIEDNMFIDNEDGTFTVKFFKDGKADYVTVDQFLPNGGNVYASARQELWVALAEKAYAQLNEEGGLGQDDTNSYEGISGGWSRNTMKHITGKSTDSGKITHYNKIANQFNSQEMVTLWTKGGDKKLYLDTAQKIVANHEYVMTGYDKSTRTYKLYNPWGQALEVNRSELKAYFGGWTYSKA